MIFCDLMRLYKEYFGDDERNGNVMENSCGTITRVCEDRNNVCSMVRGSI